MNTEDEEYNVKNEGSRNLTYMPWHEHAKEFLLSQWKLFFIFWVGIFGIFWGLIEAFSFFISDLSLSNIAVLSTGLIIGLTASLIHCTNMYIDSPPKGLENEPLKIQKIAFSKKQYWEYALAYELIKSRIHEIDQELEDVIKNRVHIKIKRVMSTEQYSEWLQTRPENLLRIVAVAKQLLIFDLIEAIHANESNEVDYHNLIRTIELIKDAYKSAYEFEVEGREIKIPEELEAVHEIQAGWASVVRDGFHQMLEILQSVATRKKGDFSPLDKTIVFKEPPRIDEFCEELEKITASIGYQ
ncbi:hypothetical protein [Pseudomonas sp. 1928-m]|uniref:hypothetical protein n=1 Tax=Pseudomonas sp. 1928-m TaxID=3033804 RepID=UPI0023DFB033|nr:hypothetical protein [Pseudomonas sp. 1928-m]MDF3195579.1 hypothetical protein [Pseudomonas sp. 1928-m]